MIENCSIDSCLIQCSLYSTVSGFDGWRGMWVVTLLLGTKTYFMYVIIVVSKIFWFTRETLFLLNGTILTCIWINCEMYLDLNYVIGMHLNFVIGKLVDCCCEEVHFGPWIWILQVNIKKIYMKDFLMPIRLILKKKKIIIYNVRFGINRP